MKNILCFGDSLTWGTNPENNTRHPFEQRWTGILQQKLGNDYRIIEEGLPGRNTAIDDSYFPHRNGAKVLPMLLDSHAPLDLVILFLGFNDIKPVNHCDAKTAARGCAALTLMTLKSATGPQAKPPQVLLLSPPHIGSMSGYMASSFEGVEKESHHFALHYQRVAEFFKIHFLDTAPIITVSKHDGIHLDAPENKKLGEKIAEKVLQIFS